MMYIEKPSPGLSSYLNLAIDLQFKITSRYKYTIYNIFDNKQDTIQLRKAEASVNLQLSFGSS